MTVLTIKETGHVVGAVTLTGDFAPNAENLVGDGLLVRGFVSGGAVTDEQFVIAAGELETKPVAVEAAVFLQPRKYHVVDDTAAAASLPVTSVTLTSIDVTITVPAVSESTKIWVQIDDASLQNPQIVKGNIAAGGTSYTLPINTLAPGDYYVLALVARHSMFVGTQTVP